MAVLSVTLFGLCLLSRFGVSGEKNPLCKFCVCKEREAVINCLNAEKKYHLPDLSGHLELTTLRLSSSPLTSIACHRLPSSLRQLNLMNLDFLPDKGCEITNEKCPQLTRTVIWHDQNLNWLVKNRFNQVSV